MAAGAELERLLAAVVGVYSEGEIVEVEIEIDPDELVPQGAWQPLEGADGEVFATYMRALRKILGALRHSYSPRDVSRTVLHAALGGAEWVLREEILSGHVEELPAMLPSFAYLISLSFLSYEEALQRSEQVRELLQAQGYSPR